MSDGTIKVQTIDDGGNPRDQSSIDQIDFNTFRVTPFSEDNDPNYKFRFEVCASNNSGKNQQLGLQVNWNEPVYNKYRTSLYHRSEAKGRWTHVSMRTEGESTSGNITLPPGISTIASQPSYSYSDNLRFIENIASFKNINVACIGRTAEKRKIHHIVLNDNTASRKKRSIVIICRIHPYETAGSYCAEGIADALIHKNIATIGNIDRYHIHVIPMANPDGVFGGLCKRTAYDGIDMSKHVDQKDLTCSAIISFLDFVRPHIYCEIHNWMLPNVDGIYFLNRFQASRLTRRLPRRVFKKWEIDFNKIIFAKNPVGLKEFCRDKFNSTAFVVEFPWSGRNTGTMKNIGVHMLKAISYL